MKPKVKARCTREKKTLVNLKSPQTKTKSSVDVNTKEKM